MANLTRDKNQSKVIVNSITCSEAEDDVWSALRKDALFESVN